MSLPSFDEWLIAVGVGEWSNVAMVLRPRSSSKGAPSAANSDIHRFTWRALPLGKSLELDRTPRRARPVARVAAHERRITPGSAPTGEKCAIRPVKFRYFGIVVPTHRHGCDERNLWSQSHVADVESNPRQQR